MKQYAVVTALIDDDAIVSGERQSACGGCAGKSACGTLGSWNKRPVSMRVHNLAGARIGDKVEIEVDDQLMLKASFRLYILPLLAFFVFAGIGWLLFQQETLAIVSGAGGIALCYAWIRHQDRHLPPAMARITAVVESAHLNFAK